MRHVAECPLRIQEVKRAAMEMRERTATPPPQSPYREHHMVQVKHGYGAPVTWLEPCNQRAQKGGPDLNTTNSSTCTPQQAPFAHAAASVDPHPQHNQNDKTHTNTHTMSERPSSSLRRARRARRSGDGEDIASRIHDETAASDPSTCLHFPIHVTQCATAACALIGQGQGTMASL